MPVIMGRITFESLGGKPLIGRQNIIISKHQHVSAYNNVSWSTSVNDAIEQAKKLETKEIFIAGGSQIYELAMPLANRIYLTRVHASFEADAFFPIFNMEEWELSKNTDFSIDEKHAYSFSIQQWDKKGEK